MVIVVLGLYLSMFLLNFYVGGLPINRFPLLCKYDYALFDQIETILHDDYVRDLHRELVDPI